MVTLGADALARFPRFTLYNSPYVAHREGRAIDLYPGTETAPSPVAGEVISTETMACPSRPYAAANDHLIVIDTGDRLARILHVDPAVEPGQAVAVGDPLGRLIRSGYFARWVDNHVHLGFREHGADPVRASGSLRLAVDVPVEGVGWDGRGTVVESGETYTILDTPSHPAPGDGYVGITDESGRFVLDGGLPHYPNGGIVPVTTGSISASGDNVPNPDSARSGIDLLGVTLAQADGRELPWEGVSVFANGSEITGLSFFLGREEMYAKLITPESEFAAGEAVEVDLRSD